MRSKCGKYSCMECINATRFNCKLNCENRANKKNILRKKNKIFRDNSLNNRADISKVLSILYPDDKKRKYNKICLF